MRKAGASSESIAKALHAERRALGVEFKNLTPPDMLQKIYSRNIEKYGDKLGPSIDYLRGKGKTWENIIESATRTLEKAFKTAIDKGTVGSTGQSGIKALKGHKKFTHEVKFLSKEFGDVRVFGKKLDDGSFEWMKVGSHKTL